MRSQATPLSLIEARRVRRLSLMQAVLLAPVGVAGFLTLAYAVAELITP